MDVSSPGLSMVSTSLFNPMRAGQYSFIHVRANKYSFTHIRAIFNLIDHIRED